VGNQGNSNKNIPFQLVGQVNTKLHGESTDSTNCGSNCLLTCEGKNIYFVSHHCVHHYKLSLSQGVPIAYPEQAVSGVDTFTVNRQTQNIVTAIFSTKMDGVVCIGTSGGSIMKYDFNTKQTVVILNGQSGPHITALLHYVTSDMCQVVVGGNASGMLFWHVTRPHQNGFVSLLSEQKHKTKITGLEIVGNQMISCSEDGQVYFWSVGGPMPVGLGSYTVCEAGAEELVSLLIVDQEYHFMALSKSISSEVSHLTPCVWKYGNPPSVVDCLRELTSSVCCAGVVEFAPSQSLVAIGLANGIVNIYSSPHFVLSAQLLFEDMNESSCVKMAATLETLPASHNNHPSLADALIVTLWSCGVIKICKAVR
jgi:WD40 repeat protein